MNDNTKLNDNKINKSDNTTSESSNTKRKKSKDGEGSVYQLKNGRWTGKLYLGKKPDGKPNRKTFSGKTETEVRRKIKAFNKEKDKYLAENVASISFEEYINKWLYEYKRNELADSSFDRLEYTIKGDIIPHLGYLQLGNVTPDDIQEEINNMYEDGKSHSTIKKMRDACNGCFRYAVSRRDMQYNPVSGVNVPSKNRFEKKEIQILSDNEVKQFEKEAVRQFRTGLQVHKYGHVFILLLNTGLRRGEVLGIDKNEDIDLDKNILHIRNSVIKTNIRDKNNTSKVLGQQVVLQQKVKTDAGRRIIPLNRKARNAIEYLMKSPSNKESSLLISNDEGAPVAPDLLGSALHRLLDNMQIKRFGCHVLRHTFASRMFEQGEDIKIISEILGHATISITYDTYIHLIREQKAKAMESLDFDDEDSKQEEVIYNGENIYIIN